jgi:hypothetical protein
MAVDHWVCWALLLVVVKQAASSRLTLFWKFISPAIYGVPFGIATVALMLKRDWMAALFAVPFLAAVATYVWFCPRFMLVEFDEELLYISNGRREIRVPWSQVDYVCRLMMSRWPTYAISFRSPTEFGSKIFFSTPFGHHDIVQKIRHRVTPDGDA